jgi:predicted DCC family thiol-disulfide oxidoreductase YuxK
MGIYLTLRAPFFQMIYMYAAFVPLRALVVRLRERVAARPRTRLYYDDGCPLCIRSVTVVQYFDLTGRIAYCPLSAPESERALAAAGVPMSVALSAMHVLDPDGHPHAGVDAIRAIGRSVLAFRLLTWLLALPGAQPAAVAVYRRIAASRSRVAICEDSSTCALHAPPGPQSEIPSSLAVQRKS